MNKISMETRDQWYKPNLLFNIHWRPHKEPETPKMVVETVQFNPSVCTCGQHDCQPRYRMEKRVLWSNKEMHSTKQKMEEGKALAKFDKCGSKQNDSTFDDKKDARRIKKKRIIVRQEFMLEMVNDCLTPDGNIKGDTKRKDDSNLECTKKDNHMKSVSNNHDYCNGHRKNGEDGVDIENGDDLSTDNEKHGVDDAIGSNKSNCVERIGDRFTIDRGNFGVENGENCYVLQRGDENHGGGETIGVDKCDSLRTCDGEKDECGSGDENGESFKTDGQKHDGGLYADGSNCNDIERTGDVVKGDGENDDDADGLKTYGIKNDGGLHIGRSNCDDVGRTGHRVKRKEVSNDENDEDDHGLKTDAIKNDGGLKKEGKRHTGVDDNVIHIVNGGAGTSVSVSDIIDDDGYDRATEDGDIYIDGISETIDDDRLENLLNEQENNEDYDDISPAFGILSIYCNSELHCMVSNSPTSNIT